MFPSIQSSFDEKSRSNEKASSSLLISDEKYGNTGKYQIVRGTGLDRIYFRIQNPIINGLFRRRLERVLILSENALLNFFG